MKQAMTKGLWALVCFSAMAAWAQDTSSGAERRRDILARAAKLKLTLEEGQTKANAAYDDVEATLKTEMTRLRETQAARRVEHGVAVREIDKKYDETLSAIEQTKKDDKAAHDQAIAALDKELEAIKERARAAYTEEVSAELKRHDEKRLAAEVERKKRADAVEATRLRAIDTYLSDIAKTQEAQEQELKGQETARLALLADHDKRRTEAREVLRKALADLETWHRDAHAGTVNELYEAVGVPGRTAPPLGAERHDLVDLTSERADVTSGLKFDIEIDGKSMPDDDSGKKMRDAFTRALAGTLKAEDGFDALLRTLRFGKDGQIEAAGKTLVLRFATPLDEGTIPMPVTVERVLRGRIERAIIAAHDRAPWDNFEVQGKRPYFYVLDAEGNVAKPQSASLLASVRTIVNAKTPGSVRGLTLEAAGPAFDGKPLKLQWLIANDGAYEPVDAPTQQDLDRRFAEHVGRLAGVGAIPASVRERLANDRLESSDSNLQRAIAIFADTSCTSYRFYRQGRELIVVDATTTKALFRLEGVARLTRVACGPNGGLAFAATRLRLAQNIERAWTKQLPNDLKTADLADDAETTTVKDGAEALFVYAGGKLTLAMAPTLGRFGAIRASGAHYLVWLWDKEERQLIEDLTLKLAADGSSAEPDVAAKPGPAQLALQPPPVVAPAPREKKEESK